MILFGKPKIDSLRLHLPLTNVQVNPEHQSFLQKLTTINTLTSEVLDENVKTTHFTRTNGISCSYAVRTIFGQQTLFIGFSSKVLKDLYFEGINKNTIQIAFNYINNEGVVKISKEDFLNASVVDVDFCIDYFLKGEDATVKNTVFVCSEATKEKFKGVNYKYTQSKNTGIQWGNRNTVGRSYQRKQFLKYYAKAIQLQYDTETQSDVFYNTYLKPKLEEKIITENGITSFKEQYFKEDKLLRVETTIKNSDHFKTFDYKVKSLNDLLSIDFEANKFSAIFNRPISNYMTGHQEIKHTEKMTLTQKFKFKFLRERAKNLSMQIEDVVPMVALEFYPKNKNQRSNLKRELYKIINMAEVGKKTHKHNTEDWHLFIEEIQSKKLIP